MELREAITEAAATHRPARWSEQYCTDYDRCKFSVNRTYREGGGKSVLPGIQEGRRIFAAHVADEALKLMGRTDG